jgi:hypothetical protein
VARALAAAREPGWREAVARERGALFGRHEPVDALSEALLAWGSGSVRRTPAAVY